MKRKILVMGLPGAGKTTLAMALAPLLGAVHWNADGVRRNICRDLGFSPEDRIEQAHRMGWLCDQVVAAGGYAIADFICPTPETRRAFFGSQPSVAGIIVFVDRIAAGRFDDTNKLFVGPKTCDVRVLARGTPEYWAEQVWTLVRRR